MNDINTLTPPGRADDKQTFFYNLQFNFTVCEAIYMKIMQVVSSTFLLRSTELSRSHNKAFTQQAN